MFDVLKTLSGLVKTKKAPVRTKEMVKAEPEHHKISTEKVKVQSAPFPQKSGISDEEIKQKEAAVKLAEAKARELILEAKDQALQIRQQVELETRKRLEVIDKREGALDERDRRTNEKLSQIENRLEEIEKLKLQYLNKLESLAGLTKDDAKKQIITDLQDKIKEEIAREIKEAEIEATEKADEKAKEILVDAMKHGATDYVAEYTVSVVKIADEEVKGRIIGKEGRNIRAFETATGVDVDLDEEGVIRLSSFDPVRREIARVSLERLLRDGRVQPGRIEDIIVQVKKEVERIMFEEGQKLCHAVGVYNLPAPLVANLGRFKYRFSYGQNMIAHTLEETKIGIALANETRADVNIVRLGCLLHDIGKVINDKEGNHIDLGVDLLKKFNIPQKVIDCVAQHHEDTPFTSKESVLVYIADAISGSRPGARYEDYEEYIKRLTDLEDIAKKQKGVMESFAFQAGRELRVIVNPETVSDADITIMARNIKNEIQQKLTYPGQVKVTVVREIRASDVAS